MGLRNPLEYHHQSTAFVPSAALYREERLQTRHRLQTHGVTKTLVRRTSHIVVHTLDVQTHVQEVLLPTHMIRRPSLESPQLALRRELSDPHDKDLERLQHSEVVEEKPGHDERLQCQRHKEEKDSFTVHFGTRFFLNASIASVVLRSSYPPHSCSG